MSRTCNCAFIYSWIFDIYNYIHAYYGSGSNPSTPYSSTQRRNQKKNVNFTSDESDTKSYFRTSIIETTSKSVKGYMNEFFPHDDYHYKNKEHIIKCMYVNKDGYYTMSSRSSVNIPKNMKNTL